MRESRSSGFPTRSDTKRSVQLQKAAGNLKFRIKEEEELFYRYSESKGADHLRLCFHIGKNPVFS